MNNLPHQRSPIVWFGGKESLAGQRFTQDVMDLYERLGGQ